MSQQEVTEPLNNMSQALKTLSNPFERSKDSTATVKPSRIMVTLPQSEPPVTTRVQAQVHAVPLPASTPSSRKRIGPYVVQQQTIDSLSQNSDKFKSRVAELEGTVTLQQTQIEQKDATIKSQEAKMILLQHEFRNDNTFVANLQLRVDKAEEEREKAEQSAGRSHEEVQNTKSKLDASKTNAQDHAMLQAELVTVRGDLAKISEAAKSHKREVQRYQEELRKAQTQVLDAKQKAELARKEAKDLKKTAESADASAKGTTKLEARITELEAQLKENSISAQQRRNVMLQSQIEDLNSKQEKELANLEKAHKRIAELEQDVEPGAVRRARREELQQLKMQYESAEHELNSSDARLEVANKRVASLETEIARLTVTVSESLSTQKKVDELKAEMVKLKNAKSMAEDEVNTFKVEIQTLKKKVVELEAETRKKDGDIAKADTYKREVRQRLSDFAAEVTSLKNQASAEMQKINTLTYESQDMKEQLATSRSECRTWTNKLKTVESAAFEAQRQFANSTRTKDGLEKELHKLKSRNGQVESQLYQLEDSLAGEQNFAEGLRKNVSALTHQLNDEKRARQHAESEMHYWKSRADQRYYYRQ